MNDVADFWSDERSVLFTSWLGWGPDTWGGMGWTDESERKKKLKKLSDPFICICYVAKWPDSEEDQKGKICGFYLVSHEKCNRDECIHPVDHNYEKESWRYSVKASRAFDYLPEYRLSGPDVFPELSPKEIEARENGKWVIGEIIIDPEKITKLRGLPWEEVYVYSPSNHPESSAGMVKSGPARGGGYEVSGNIQDLPHELYVLQLAGGETAAYLGRKARKGASIYKIGLSISPEIRRDFFRKAMPKGAFCWKIDRTTRVDGDNPYENFFAAEAGETAMKLHLAKEAEHLGGEFYLATKTQIDKAWAAGRKAAKNYKAKD